jgi:hypothetical protein
MKLDFNVVREILMTVEDAPAQQFVSSVSIEGVDKSVILEHVELLINDDFLDGSTVIGEQGWPVEFDISRLTMKGHAFVRNARNDTVWKKVTSEAKEKGVSVSMTILDGLLTKALGKYLGL